MATTANSAKSKIQTKLFNSLTKFANGGDVFRTLTMPAGSTVGDLIDELSVPESAIFLVLRNGRDVTPSLYGGINTDEVLSQDDVVALSGPVPYGWGYGSPVV